jgi:hypothetical protein
MKHHNQNQPQKPEMQTDEAKGQALYAALYSAMEKLNMLELMSLSSAKGQWGKLHPKVRATLCDAATLLPKEKELEL